MEYFGNNVKNTDQHFIHSCYSVIQPMHLLRPAENPKASVSTKLVNRIILKETDILMIECLETSSVNAIFYQKVLSSIHHHSFTLGIKKNKMYCRSF